jgi:membrane protease YdiL (CAAX protease family)
MAPSLAVSLEPDPPVRRPILPWFALALGLSWAAWIPYAAGQAGRIAIRIPAELIWLSEYGPSVAALLLVRWREGSAGLRRLGARLIRWRVPARWYGVALLLTPAVAAVTLAAMAVLRGPVDLARLSGWDHRFIERTSAFSPSIGLITSLIQFMKTGPLATALVFAGLAVTNGGLSEEIGWRGYVLPELSRRRGPLVASLGVGILWALWHTGTGFWLTIMTASTANALGFAARYLGQYLLLVLPLAIAYTWLYRGTGGSLLLVILLHASYNMTVTLVTGAWPDFPFAWFLTGLYLVAAAIAWSPGFRPKPTAVG